MIRSTHRSWKGVHANWLLSDVCYPADIGEGREGRDLGRGGKIMEGEEGRDRGSKGPVTFTVQGRIPPPIPINSKGQRRDLRYKV